MPIMLTPITHTGYHHLPVRLSLALLIFVELNICWQGPQALVPITCLAWAVPNRYMVHCHKFYPEFLTQVDVSCDVLGESDLLQETASDMFKYMVHETSITTDSGYHSSHPTVPAPLDVSRGYMGAGSANPKVHCPFSQGESLVSLPGEMDEILSPVLCEDTGHSNVKVPGQVLHLASTPTVSRKNLGNAARMFPPFGESETFGETDHPIPCDSISIEEKVLPSIKFPTQSLTASHPIGVDEDLEDYVC